MASKLPSDSASFMFRFLGDVWLLLPLKDRRKLSNFWAAAIKITGDLQNTGFELDLSTAVQDVPVLNNEMWNKFQFNDETKLSPSPDDNFPYAYFLGDSRIRSIPSLQDRIDRPNKLLIEGADYYVSNNLALFKEDPESFCVTQGKSCLWAKDTLVNNEKPFRNFGEFIDLYQSNSDQYLRVLQGVWYAYWNGPTVTNILTSLYLLFAIPTAPYNGTVTDIYINGDNESHVVITSDDGLDVTDLLIPVGLEILVNVGDTVNKFDLICTGVRVVDKEIDPFFMTNEVGRAGVKKYLTQNATIGEGDTDETAALDLLAENLWVSQVSADIFVSNIDIPAIRNFLSTIRPQYTDYVFQVIRLLEDSIGFGDEIVSQDIDLDITVNTENTPVNILNDERFFDYVENGNENLNIDMDALSFREEMYIDVYDNGGTLIDTVISSI